MRARGNPAEARAIRASGATTRRQARKALSDAYAEARHTRGSAREIFAAAQAVTAALNASQPPAEASR